MINEHSAHLYCKDDIAKIENYDKAFADNTQTWVIHHRLELTLDGEFAHSPKELQRLGMYFNRPYFELIFLTRAEHRRLHMLGMHHSDATRKKISVSCKRKVFTAEHRQKLSEAKKGKQRSSDIRQKISKANKGKILSDETRTRMAKAQKARWARYRQEKEHE